MGNAGGERMKKGLLLSGACLFLILVGLRWNSAPFFSVAEYRCMKTGHISSDYFSSIQEFAGTLLHNGYSARAVINQLQQQFPIIKKITIAYHPAEVQLKIYAYEPLCCINDAFVLTPQCELFSKDIFSQKALAAISNITVAPRCMLRAPILLTSLLQELPLTIDHIYNVELMHEHCVRLTDKQERKFTIVTSVEQNRMSQLMTHCDLIKKSISERKGFDKGVKWVADTRFADYIVAYKV